MNSTRKYYEKNSKTYFDATYSIPVNLYNRFLKYIPEGGSIIDIGCGSGRDSKYFYEHRYIVEALDESTALCKIVKDNIRIKVIEQNRCAMAYPSLLIIYRQ